MKVHQTILLLLVLAATTGARAENPEKCFSAIYALKAHRLDDAISLYTQCINQGDLSTENLIVAYNDRGNAYGKKGDYQQALADFDQVIKLSPEDADGYYNRGLTYKKLHKPSLAVVDYTTAISHNPKYAKAFNNRGGVYGEQGKFKLAVADFDRAIDIDPGDASSYFNRGLAFYSLGNYPQAIEDLQKAIDLDPRYRKAYENLAWLRATCPDASLRDGSLALSLAKKAYFLRGTGTPGLYDIMAAAYASQGRYEMAIKYQQLAIETAGKEIANKEFEKRLALYKSDTAYQESGGNRFLVNG